MANPHGTASVSVGQMMEFGAAVLRQLPRDITPEQAQRWIQDQGALQSALRGILIPASNGQSTIAADSTYPVSVNYDQTLKAMIKAGKYDWTNDNIVQMNFPHDKSRGIEEITIELIKYDADMESHDVITDLDSRGLRPATIEELCAFGASYPDVQRQFPMVALGSPWAYRYGNREVPVLITSGSARILDLDWWSNRWLAPYRFAAVRKAA